jgi:ribulose-phosphate 3-epimerase
MRIIPALLPQTYDQLIDGFFLAESFTTHIHLDVVDGKYAPYTSYPFSEEVQTDLVDTLLIPPTSMHVSVHLMTEDVHALGQKYIHAGAEEIIVHYAGFGLEHELVQTLALWKDQGVITTLAFSSADDPYAVSSIITELSIRRIHCMTISDIGVQGNPFDASALSLISKIRMTDPSIYISADGGISESNISLLKEAGVNDAIVGSAIMKSENPQTALEILQHLAH